MTDWWAHYIDGKIVRRSDTPQSIISTMEDWFDGNDAFRQFIDGKPVSPRRLVREIKACEAECVLGEKEDVRLRLLAQWAEREGRLASAACDLREARQAFGEAVKAVGLHPSYADRIANIEL